MPCPMLSGTVLCGQLDGFVDGFAVDLLATRSKKF